MKKNYVSPEIKVVKSVLEGEILRQSYDWGDAKQNNFFEEEDDNLKGNDLWDNDKDNLWE